MVSENFDVVFIASPAANPSWGYDMRCYRALWCDDGLTEAGSAFTDFRDEQR